MKTPSKKGNADFLFLFLVLVLVGFGIAMVFSASSMTTSFTKSDPWFFTKKQLIAVGFGLISMLIIMNIPYMKLKKMIFPTFITVLIFLIYLIINGEYTNGAKSWLYLGNFGLQPAEFAKLAIILLLASVISRKEEKFRDFKKGLLPAVLTTCVVCGLILLQPDLGSAFVVFLSAFFVVLIGGSNLKHIFALSILLSVFIALIITISLTLATNEQIDYRLERLTSFLNPWESQLDGGYQLVQSLLALGHGGIGGTGIGQSVQKLQYLPEAHNDFIFSVIGEELGFIGVSIFILIYLLFIWRGIVISLRCNQTFGMLSGTGIMCMIASQALINIGGVTGAIPLTGVTLPFISYGGSSMMMTLICMGFVLSFSRDASINNENNSLKKTTH
jgi:cell division protein FtsW